MDTLPPSAAAEAVTGIVITLLAYFTICFGIYKLCTTQRGQTKEEARTHKDEIKQDEINLTSLQTDD